MSRRHCCGRGILKFRDELLPNSSPGRTHTAGNTSLKEHDVFGFTLKGGTDPGINKHKNNSDNSDNDIMTIDIRRDEKLHRDMKNFPTISITNNRPNTSDSEKNLMLAKYSYMAKQDQPGGFLELSIIQGEKLSFLQEHPNNPHWVKAENFSGQQGYVPKSYTMLLKSQSDLPWLEQKKQDIDEERQKEKKRLQVTGFGIPERNKTSYFKPYSSAYSKHTGGTTQTASKYRCELCVRNFNGPKPYKMHLASRAHKEEEERIQGL